MKQKFRLIYSLFTLVFFSSLFINYSGGYDGNAAGAPSEGTCSGCHGGGSVTMASVVDLVGAPTRYTQGQTYALTLSVTHPSALAAGFQIVATNGSTGAMVGSFTAGSGSRVTGSGRLTHDGRNALSSMVASWAFDWKAPTSGGPNNVVFYYVGNAVNNDFSTGGDAVLSGNKSTVLPIELLSFSATRNDDKSVNLTWATASERNNAHFSVEKSVDNQKFEKIGQLQGKGNATNISKYQFSDDVSNSANLIVYYRLRQVDIDGTATYSKVVSVDIRSKKALSIYPNLAKRGDVLTVDSDKNGAIQVLNINGQVVQTINNSTNNAASNDARGPLSIGTADLPSGRYFVRLVGNGLVETSGFVVY